MPQSKILIDTNTYIRLAQTIKPLLAVPFGDEQYCLYVIPEMDSELSGRRLATKFSWVQESEYVASRKHYPSVSKKQKNAIEQNLDFLWSHVQTDLPGPSKVDTLYVAYALELEIPVVTDDLDMQSLAETYGVKVLSTLELLKMMVSAGHIDLHKVDSLVGYWRHINDKPGNLAGEYRRLFGKEPP